MRKFLAIISFFIWAKPCAAALVDLSLFYMQGTTTAATSSSAGVTNFSGYVGISMDRQGRFHIGWNYASYSTSTTASSTTTYNSTQMGPSLVAFLNKAHNWRLGFSYNLITSASYQTTSGSTEAWGGTGLSTDIGYQFYFFEKVMVGCKFNYSTTNYTTKLIGNTQSSVNYNETLIYPSIGLAVEF